MPRRRSWLRGKRAGSAHGGDDLEKGRSPVPHTCHSPGVSTVSSGNSRIKRSFYQRVRQSCSCSFGSPTFQAGMQAAQPTEGASPAAMAQAPPLTLTFHGKTRHLSRGTGKFSSLIPTRRWTLQALHRQPENECPNGHRGFKRCWPVSGSEPCDLRVVLH